MAYKALMLSGIPNFLYTIGYTNASWTLKADLVVGVRRAACSRTWTRNGLRQRGRREGPDASASSRSWTSAPATCCARSTSLPKQGDRAPWLLKQNYITDLRTISNADIDDGVLAFAE